VIFWKIGGVLLFFGPPCIYIYIYIYIYKWLGTGAPWVKEQKTRNWPNCTNHHESAHQNDYNCTFRAKKVEGHDRKFFRRLVPDWCPPLSRWTGAPTFKFFPAPLRIPIRTVRDSVNRALRLQSVIIGMTLPDEECDRNDLVRLRRTGNRQPLCAELHCDGTPSPRYSLSANRNCICNITNSIANTN